MHLGKSELLVIEGIHALNPNLEKQTIANFMYQVLQNDIAISDDTEQTRKMRSSLTNDALTIFTALGISYDCTRGTESNCSKNTRVQLAHGV